MSIIPKHVAIIMDGNGRWARRRGLPRAAGHRAGAKTTHAIVEEASRAGVKTLTLFAFSSENWKRPRSEVRLLMDLLRRTIRKELPALHANDVCMSFIGDRSQLSRGLLAEMAAAEQQTQYNQGLQLLIAIDYGGRWDIVHRARELAVACQNGQLQPDSIDEALFNEGLSLGRFPAPDLFIRTGGERRISNFLLWDLAYSELYFSDVLWPEFDNECLHQALQWYTNRERRFGSLTAS